ncbi:lysolipid transporter protein spinster isoform X1 [Leptinotarsa decemlineata]|uniref:lysolipid transporter protein spinster isoform X1 n=1 Tax=Leptinotarsa decemlineata TaxID=7539 RepID=UPI000C25278C|nr:protein spinster isoform X1 [Leptinotarsa decemlineata]
MPSEKLEVGSNFLMKKFKMETTEIAPNESQQELVQGSEEVGEQREKTLRDVTFREWVAVFVLCFVNLINYMDRFTIAGILGDIKTFYGIHNGEAGLLQTAFVLSYMIFAPLFGYLGDRYSRRWIMAAGVFLWSLTTLFGSFMDNFWWFMLFRALVGIGEASYSTIAPTIISDYFVGDVRSKMLALFYFAIPVGSGMGYIVGSETAKAVGQWQWALRVTPALGVIAVALIIFVLVDPERGQSECSGHMEATPWVEDIKDIVHNRSFMFSTAGFTCVAFVAGALAWWGPSFIEMGIKLQSSDTVDSESVAYKFGIISMVSGLIGVPFGSFLAQRLRPNYHRIDAHICAVGLLVSSPLVFFACLTARYSASLCFSLVFFAEFFLNLTWSIVADILLYVVLPTRRSTAEGFQLLVSHALGDAGSPYLIGVLSDAFRIGMNPINSENSTTDDTDLNKFKSLQYALFSTCFVEVIGGLFFLITAFYIVHDKRKVEEAVHGIGRKCKMFDVANKIASLLNKEIYESNHFIYYD